MWRGTEATSRHSASRPGSRTRISCHRRVGAPVLLSSPSVPTPRARTVTVSRLAPTHDGSPSCRSWKCRLQSLLRLPEKGWSIQRIRRPVPNHPHSCLPPNHSQDANHPRYRFSTQDSVPLSISAIRLGRRSQATSCDHRCSHSCKNARQACRTQEISLQTVSHFSMFVAVARSQQQWSHSPCAVLSELPGGPLGEILRTDIFVLRHVRTNACSSLTICSTIRNDECQTTISPAASL